MEMLEASRMDRTDVTQGDLEELCELSLRGNMRQEGVPSSNPGLLDLGFATNPSGELLKPGEGSTHTPASVESASRTLTETTGSEAWLVRVKEAKEAAQQSNNNNPGSCAIKEGEENMNIQGSNRFLSNNRFVTTRDEESAVGNSDDVFLAEEESQSFQQQVSHVTYVGGNYIHPLAGHHRPPLPPTGSKMDPSPASKKTPGQERTSVCSLTSRRADE